MSFDNYFSTASRQGLHLGIFNACEVEQNQCKMFTKKNVAKNITFPTVFCTYYLVATVFGSNFLNQKDICRSTC